MLRSENRKGQQRVLAIRGDEVSTAILGGEAAENQLL